MAVAEVVHRGVTALTLGTASDRDPEQAPELMNAACPLTAGAH